MNYCPGRRDIHVLKYFSSFISVSKGEVIYVSEPTMRACPLASHFYEELRYRDADTVSIKQALQTILERKIRQYGFFTSRRDFTAGEIQVPYGASEMLMFALRNRVIDAAVVVCDGAGTVISDSAETIQGIGARMHAIIMTSPVAETIRSLTSRGCHVVSRDAMIDQYRGVRRAAEIGYKTIAVTIDGHSAGQVEQLKTIERYYGVKVISLIVCTTGIQHDTVQKIVRYADLVWSCASALIRTAVGPIAKLQLSELMPVFAISDSGVYFAAGYSQDPAQFVSCIDTRKKYLVSLHKQGKRIAMGNFTAYLRQERQLPVLSPKFSIIANAQEGFVAVSS